MCFLPLKDTHSFEYLFYMLAKNKNMKKLIAIYAVTITLAFGIASPAFAQHCNTQQGDSMWKIAKRYHVIFHELLKLNQHYPNQDLIHKGDKIELPDGSTGNETDQNSGSDNIKEDDNETTERGESSQAKEVLDLVNAERKKQGLAALTLSSKLTSVANTKAKDMAVNKYFAHESPTYGTPFQMLQQFGVKYSYAGENIAAGQRTSKEVMNSWMNSSGHRANILNKNYTELGVGFYAGGSYDTYWVQLFIKP